MLAIHAAGAVRAERGLPLGFDPSAPVVHHFVLAARGIAFASFQLHADN